MFITKFANRVTVIVLHDEGILDCNKQAAEKALSHPKMDFIWNSVLTEVCGEEQEMCIRDSLLPDQHFDTYLLFSLLDAENEPVSYTHLKEVQNGRYSPGI